jgi:DNA repair exonuclease SbcCD ATPase subunit
LELEKYNTEDKMVNTIIQIKNVIKEYETYLELNNEKIKIESNIEFIEENESYIKSDKVTKNKILKIKEEYQQKLNKVNHDLDKLKEVKDNYELIKKNVDHRDKIKLLDTTINTQQTLLNEYSNKINDYEQNKINKTYLDEIKELEEKISEEEDKELEKYNEYSQLLKDIDILEKDQYSIKLQKEKLLNNSSKSENCIKDNQIILNRINSNKDNYDKYCEIKKEFDKVNKEFQIIEKEFNESNKLVEKNDIKMGELKEQCIIAKNILKKCEDTINDIKDFELLVNIFKNNGLCDKLLKDQIIVNLQKAIDDICTYIGHEKIYIILESSPNNITKKYNIIIKTYNIKDISNSGGFQNNIIDLIFKLAFLRINSYFKSDFIIIDEIFDACSEDNKPMTIKLLEYFKTQYKKLLLVSHNQSIVNLFDQRLTITHDIKNGNSIVQK